MNYSVAEFRRNIRAALDLAASGEDVFINRHDRVFKLVAFGVSGRVIALPEKNTAGATPHKADPAFQDEIGEIQPRIKTPGTPFRTDEEWKEAEALEQSCCQKKSPCRHWFYSPERALWINTLSQREREIAT